MHSDGLLVTVNNAILLEEKRARGRKRTNSAVAAAMIAEREHELMETVRQRAVSTMSLRDNQKRLKTIKKLKEEQAACEQRRLALHKASTLVESLRALKSFDTADFGQGHKTGGTRQHATNRRSVLDRIRARAQPLQPEQANDWDWFVRHWDRARLANLGPAKQNAWGAMFRDIAKDLLERLQGGEHDAVSRWMRKESRRFLGMPALRC